MLPCAFVVPSKFGKDTVLKRIEYFLLSILIQKLRGTTSLQRKYLSLGEKR